MFSLSPVTLPDFVGSPLITVAVMKAHSRVVSSDEDDNLAGYLLAATERAERDTHRSLGPQVWKLVLDTFPYERNNWGFISSAAIKLLKPPVTGVTSVKYLDPTGAQQTLVAGTDYIVDLDSLPPRIVPAYNTVWPSAQNYIKTVEVIYAAGYPANTCPAPILQAIKLIAATWYENRLDLVQGQANELPIPMSARSLLAQYAVRRF